MTTMNLDRASSQWASRPAQDRFESLAQIVDFDKARQSRSRTVTQDTSELEACPVNGDILLAPKYGPAAKLNSWSFNQASRLAGANPSYLRKLDNERIADLLNYGFEHNLGTDAGLPKRSGLLITDEIVAGIMSAAYDRIWSHEIAQGILDTVPNFLAPWARAVNWNGKTVAENSAPFDPTDPRMSYLINVRPGELVAPSGLYLSDRDFFAFMISPDVDFDDETGATYRKGFFAWNSHVGAASAGIEMFHFADVCGNHIVWGASNVITMSTKHSVGARGRWSNIMAQAMEMLAGNGTDYARMVSIARDHTITMPNATDEERLEAIEKMLRRAKVALPKTAVADALAIADTGKYGNPGSLWSLVNGITEASQSAEYVSDRTKLDRAAGKLLSAITG